MLFACGNLSFTTSSIHEVQYTHTYIHTIHTIHQTCCYRISHHTVGGKTRVRSRAGAFSNAVTDVFIR